MSPSTDHPEPSAPIRVMVVDDEELIRWSIRGRLEKAGHSVFAASSGEECLSLLSDAAPDIVILDLQLPGIGGLEVLDQIHQQRPQLPIMILTAHGTIDRAVQAMKRGAVDFMSKPFDLGALEIAVRRNLDNVRLRKVVAGLKAERNASRPFVRLVGSSPVMRELDDLVAKVAASDATTVLIEGESGAGKEVIARCIHFSSRRAAKPFITINCTSLPEQLVESELQGHERGAFTDAKTEKVGLFELADGGTLLLDEIGDMPLSAQAKLLRILEEKRFTRVGGTAERKVDVRVIAATHHDLNQAVLEQRFRRDLYFRLKVMPIRMPALREHVADLEELVRHFIAVFNLECRRTVRTVSEEALELMRQYDWPGNVRELRNIIERAFILGAIEEIQVEHLPTEIRRPTRPSLLPEAVSGTECAHEASLDLERLEARAIGEALRRSGGNQSGAAKLLGIGRDSLRYRMKKIGLL